MINAIINCQTSNLGIHEFKCDKCGHKVVAFNSCRNRHCPQCQSLKKEEWLFKRKVEILPVPYYHIILTLPSELNDLIYYNQKKLLTIFFKTASETLKVLGSDKKHIGCKLGFFMVLHTWGQNLTYHPHIHCVIPGGGFDESKTKWVKTKYENFFLPVKVISELFKKKFLAKLKKIYFKSDEPLHFCDCLINLKTEKVFTEFRNILKRKKWVVYCSKPFQKQQIVINYLSRYVYRTAIMSSRIIKAENNLIHFYWKDYRDNKRKIMKLNPMEFIKRVLLHVLPLGFQKIRYYGFLCNRNKTENIFKIREIFNVVVDASIDLLSTVIKDVNKVIYYFRGVDITLCPICKKGHMVLTNMTFSRFGAVP